ncbi:hypothetical protein [Flavobacterium sp. LC2016-01]|uniref:TRAFAC clade GTPase domain-containing protein n=1 Tax=Flavobacterium sp. LC2016-01 TaxID=2675876 RepID=UPI0012BB0A48|nr:hypothetical protein [Flavobacterium sp. LC2016-01]MTH15873.1 hypothetical protein [Flavobacterium sp. LC2016-01]
MTEISNKCMFLGLPNSGKSSFIGALWHVMETSEIEANYTVKIQPEDREHLNMLRQSFLDCIAPERTKTGFVKNIKLSIVEKNSGVVSDFIFPDLSGETYSSQFSYRKMTKEYVDQIKECNGLMLFVNPDYIKSPNLISDISFLLGEDKAVTEETMTSEHVPWEIEMTQTQVVIVDVLQMIVRHINKPIKICLIISAWDLIKTLPGDDGAQTPVKWLGNRMPLLKQYLEANKSSFLYETFGVSAQGGSYKAEGKDTIVEQLLLKNKQSERIIVQNGDSQSNDITMPLKWIING